MVVDSNGKGHMVRALLNTGCSKSLILKEFIEAKRCTELSEEQKTVYTTYGGQFVSKLSVSVGFRLVKFENNNDITVEHEFQVDEIHKSKRSKYDMVIGSNLLWNMGVDILYSQEREKWLDDFIPLKTVNIPFIPIALLSRKWRSVQIRFLMRIIQRSTFRQWSTNLTSRKRRKEN